MAAFPDIDHHAGRDTVGKRRALSLDQTRHPGVNAWESDIVEEALVRVRDRLIRVPIGHLPIGPLERCQRLVLLDVVVERAQRLRVLDPGLGSAV